MSAPDKRVTVDDIITEIHDGMTIAIGGWGSRRKPMALVRALLRSDVRDLTVISYGGPDVGLLCRAGKVAHVIYAFVSLDSIALEPHFGHLLKSVVFLSGISRAGKQPPQHIRFLPRFCKLLFIAALTSFFP